MRSLVAYLLAGSVPGFSHPSIVGATPHSTLPADELLSVTTIAEARVASQNCSRVAYTTLDVKGPHPPLVPPRGMDASCAFAFVSDDVIRLPSSERSVVYVSNIRSPAARDVSRRLFSKLPKLSPHLLFPGKWTVFFDTKLWMRASMDELWAVYNSRVLEPRRGPRAGSTGNLIPFTAIRHPYMWIQNLNRRVSWLRTEWSNQSAFNFMQTEANLLLAPRQPRVANASILRRQIERYVALSTTDAGPPADAYRYYIDTALLMQQDAGMLFGPWRAEIARTDSSDRDQISFAYTTAQLRLRLPLLHGCYAPMQRYPAIRHGKELCHWYITNKSGVAWLKRTIYDKKSAARNREPSAK